MPSSPATIYQASSTPTFYVETPQVRFAYRKFGRSVHANDIPLVFLQRYRGTMDDWDPALLEPLAAGRTVVLFDNAGVGRAAGATPATIPGMALAAASLIEALGFAKVDVLGFSLGGIVGQQLALDRPDLVRRLIVAASSSGTPRAGHRRLSKSGR